MSINIQKRLKDRQCLRSQPYFRKGISKNFFTQSIYGDESVMARMTLEKELYGHNGCVNTLFWSQGGDKLLSGSDDTTLCVWLPWQDYKLGYTIDTGHTQNIFSAKFMPYTSDSVVVSAAGDSEIRIFDVSEAGTGDLRQVYTCHSDRVKRIALENNPHEFMTCSEDGTVRHFDLRAPHVCSPHSVRSFLTTVRRPARQYPQPEGPNVRKGCPAPLLDYGDYGIDINSISLNKMQPQYFIVAGMDDFIYLHDRRMIGRGGRGAGKRSNWSSTSRCVKRFTSGNDRRRRRNKHITACKFSDANSQELIGSWSSDAVYLFNMHDSPIPPSPTERTFRGSSKRTRQRFTQEEETSDMDAIIHSFREAQLDICMDQLNTLRANGHENDPIQNVWALCLLSGIHLRRLYERSQSYHSPRDEYYAEEELASARQLMLEAKREAPKTWQGQWCLGCGYWIASGAQRTNGCEDRKEWLELAEEYIQNAARMYASTHPSSEENQSTPSGSTSSIDWPSRFNNLQRDINEALIREGYRERSEQHQTAETGAGSPSIDRWKWLNEMYVRGDEPQSSQTAAESLEPSTQEEHGREANSLSEDQDGDTLLDNETIQLRASSSSSSASERDYADEDEDEEEGNEDEIEEDEDLMFGSPMDTSSSAENSSDDDDDDDDESLSLAREQLNDRAGLESDVDIVAHRAKYAGHCNSRTVKDVNFYGPNDKYIVSGSDDGLFFVWDKKTRKVVQVLHGDEDTVNVVQGHPFIPVMAVSGIDDTVKIFSPCSSHVTTSRLRQPYAHTSYSESSHMYELDEIVERNREHNRSTIDHSMYITRSMIEAISHRLQNRQRLATLGELLSRSDEEDDDLPIECRVQ